MASQGKRSCDEPTSLDSSLPILQHSPVTREGQVSWQAVEGEVPDLTHLVLVWPGLASLDLARVHHQDNGFAARRVHTNQAGQPDRDAELLEHLADGRFLEYFPAVDVSGGKAPQTRPWLDQAPAEQHTARVAEDDRDCHFGVEVVDKPARGTGWAQPILLLPRNEPG